MKSKQGLGQKALGRQTNKSSFQDEGAINKLLFVSTVMLKRIGFFKFLSMEILV